MAKKTFQDQFKALEQIATDFEQGKYDLTNGLTKFEEGLKLAKNLKEQLTEVENKITTIKGKYHELASKN